MVTEEKTGKDIPSTKGDGSPNPKHGVKKRARVLDPEEWVDPNGAEPISEYYENEEIVEEDEEETDPDLQDWLDLWKERSSYKVISEYHKEGAPYLDDKSNDGPKVPPEARIYPPHDGEGDRPTDGKGGDGGKKPGTEKKTVRKKKVTEGGSQESRSTDRVRDDESGRRSASRKHARDERVKDGGGGRREKPTDRKLHIEKEEVEETEPEYEEPTGRIERVIDLNTIEFLALTLARAILPRKVRYSVKKEGVVDMDVIVLDRDVIFNSNRLVFEVPELSIWKLVFAFQGKPIIELGRGVKNGLKIYRLRMLRLLFSVWFSKFRGKKKRRALGKKGDERQG